MEYKTNASLAPERLAELFRSSGIRRPVDDLPRLARMIENADLVITAWDGEELVGVARALTDFVFCCYLSDLAVAAPYQRAGIGRELCRRVREAVGDESCVLLLAAPSAKDYYGKIGFSPVDNGWIVKRSR